MTLVPSGVDRVISRIGEIRTIAPSRQFETLLDQSSSSVTAQSVKPAHAEASTGVAAFATAAPSGAQRWMGVIRQAAERHGLDANLLTAVIWTESDFVPDAVSQAGAVGLAQLMPETAAALGVDPTDPVQNVDGGARYLREMIDRFGRTDLALAAYNAGPTRLSSLLDGSNRIPVSHTYVQTVLTRADALGGNQ
jgi:soluble lytic murein transglycosylase-like protein